MTSSGPAIGRQFQLHLPVPEGPYSVIRIIARAVFTQKTESSNENGAQPGSVFCFHQRDRRVRQLLPCCLSRESAYAKPRGPARARRCLSTLTAVQYQSRQVQTPAARSSLSSPVPRADLSTRSSVRKICDKCKIIKRGRIVRIICKNPKHKQKQG
mgnify:CR=1 FL=1